MIKLVLIDIDNTLLDFNDSARESIKLAFNKFGIEYKENCFLTFKNTNDELWAKIERGELTREELHKIRWNIVFSRLNIDYSGPVMEQEFLNNLFNCAVPVKGAVEICKYLSSKYMLCSASNAIYKQQINRLTISGLIGYFNHMFVSERIGISKPNKGFFDYIFASLPEIKKEETIFIGDSLSADIKGGVDYNIKTIWFNHDKIDKNAYNSQPIKADYIVDDLLDIKNIL